VRFKKERGGNYGGLCSPPIGGSRDPQRVAAQRKNHPTLSVAATFLFSSLHLGSTRDFSL